MQSASRFFYKQIVNNETYAIYFSWLFWIPMVFIGREVFLLRVLGTYGPTTIALFITGLREKKKGVVTLLESFRRWKVGIFWYLFSVFSTAVLTMLAIWMYLLLKRDQLVFNDLSKIYLVVPVFLFVLIISVLGEEIESRGFALPKLQEKIGPLRASLIIVVVWGFLALTTFFH